MNDRKTDSPPHARDARDAEGPEENRPSLGILVGLFLVAANAWVQYLLWFGDQGLVRWRHTQAQYLALKEDVRDAEKRIRHLKGEIALLAEDPTVLEEVARRDLGMAYPDDVLFIVEE